MKKDFRYETSDLEAMLFAKNYYNWIISKFRNRIGKRILEVGAGCGNFTEYILQESVDRVTCLEPSKNLVTKLESKFASNHKVEILNCYLNEYSEEPKKHFDTIFYINVLEHVQDDLEELIIASNKLENDGHMLITVPALPFIYGKLDKEFGHYRRYLKADLAGKVKQANMAILKIGYMDIAGILPWWFMYKVLGTQKLSARSVKIYDTIAIPICRFIERIMPIPIGKNLFLIAKRNSS